MECRLISYTDSGNIGDAIQTVALQRFLESRGFKCTGYLNRGYIEDWTNQHGVAIVNGWHRGLSEQDKKKLINYKLCSEKLHLLPKRAIFVGLHAGEEQIKCIDKDITIGCRDLYTRHIADKLGYKTVLTGCPTSSLFVKIVNDSRSNHKNANIDYPATYHPDSYLTQRIDHKMPWNVQIGHAVERLNTYIQSNKIFTSRLHVFLPCLALGVNVELDFSSTLSPERFEVFSGFELYTQDYKYNKDIHQQQLDSLRLREQWERGFAEVIADWKG